MTRNSPDYKVDGLQPSDEENREILEYLDGPSFKVLSEHHTPTDSYVILYDESTPWWIPGSPELRAVHVSRDQENRTFTADSTDPPLYPMAESWLFACGCPPEALPDLDVRSAADEITRALEARVRRDSGRFAQVDRYVGDGFDQPETVVLLRSLDSKVHPEYRILLERHDQETGTHTLREGGFATREQAMAWWSAWEDEEAPPLPPIGSTTQRFATPAMPTAPGPMAIRPPRR
ncbi:hypothetical protein [Streptomyces sp. S1]|uniref:hypothetical protein n=1 Tax=Streptomyces sp. S1 TaxID=718288 RepID=UPI003D729442